MVETSKAFAQTSSTSSRITAKPETFSLKAGLKVYGEKGYVAVQSKLSQDHDRGAFEKLLYEKIKKCLESHLFLEEQSNKDIKRSIVGSNNLRSYISKQEASSSTLHTESVFWKLGREAAEGRDIAY